MDKKLFTRGVSGVSKVYLAEYPVLEKALFEWVIRMENSRLPISGDMIKEAAKTLWLKMPDFRLIAQPSFSNGWFDGFKRRYNIKKYK